MYMSGETSIIHAIYTIHLFSDFPIPYYKHIYIYIYKLMMNIYIYVYVHFHIIHRRVDTSACI